MLKRFFVPAIFLLLLWLLTKSNPPTQTLLLPAAIWDSLLHVEQAPPTRMSQPQKLALVLSLRQAFEKGKFPEDSVYARILHRIAVYQYYTTKEYNKCVENTLHALRINTSGDRGACLSFAVVSYKNMGYYYKGLLFYDRALSYFDSAIRLGNRFPAQVNEVKACHQERSNIYSIKGDFEKCIEEATIGIRLGEDTHDTAYGIKLLKQRGFAEEELGLYTTATSDIGLDRQFSLIRKDTPALAGSLDIQAHIDASAGHIDRAISGYRQAIRLQSAIGPSSILVEYYLDQGNLLMEKSGLLTEAEASYRHALQLARQVNDPLNAAGACIDLNVLCLNLHDYPRAIGYCQEALEQLEITPGKDIRQNPPFSSLASVQDKQDLLKIFGNKTEDLLRFYGQTHRSEDLGACLRTALLADSIITALRHEQTDEPSKLFWRNRTREFYSNALEACWLAGDAKTAFFFMEKSRAVLLNDRLNELGASAFLPPREAARQQDLQLELLQQEQQLAELPDTASGYRRRQLDFLRAKDSLERYTRSLEQTAPAYFQYKYADDVPALDSFERFLSNSRHSFIHYFINDTVAYMLVITSMNARLLKLPYKGINEKLNAFLRICSDKQTLNSNYGTFAGLSHSIYRTLFQPLQIPKGRVVVCPDNFLIPFEALCPDSSGRNFLLTDYVFDYVYSARYLLKSFNNPEGKGNFLGLAPASFAAYLHVPDLPQSVTSIRAAASCYSGNTCETGQGASRRYFMEEAGSYAIVNVYSHARADSGDNEPLLFMSDSVIHLSELQLLRHPSAQLVVLSACQTNAGKNASGEGIYSLARGFASAGTPAVASTLWQADEHSIYEITEQFHRDLSLGMGKDEALQKAKLFFLRSGGNENLLPYYWANMILIGNADPVKLSTGHPYRWLIIGLACLLLLMLGLWFNRVRRSWAAG